jgi:hypothetical protein
MSTRAVQGSDIDGLAAAHKRYPRKSSPAPGEIRLLNPDGYAKPLLDLENYGSLDPAPSEPRRESQFKNETIRLGVAEHRAKKIVFAPLFAATPRGLLPSHIH